LFVIAAVLLAGSSLWVFVDPAKKLTSGKIASPAQATVLH